MNGHANPGNARSIRHGKIVACGEGDFVGYPDFSAEVHQESAVGNVHHCDAFEFCKFLHQGFAMLHVAHVYRNIANDGVFFKSGDVNCADVAADFADQRRYLPKHPRTVLNFQAHGQTVAGTWFHESMPLSAGF